MKVARCNTARLDDREIGNLGLSNVFFICGCGIASLLMPGRKVKSVNRCPTCRRGTLQRRRLQEKVLGIELGRHAALVCDACGDSYVSRKVLKTLERRAKQVGLWGSTDSRFLRLSDRFQGEARRLGITRAELRRALKNVRDGHT